MTLGGTEKAVGAAIKESGILREQIFVTTKLNSIDHGRVQEAFQESLDDLGLDRDIDLVGSPCRIIPSVGVQVQELVSKTGEGLVRFVTKL